jgi:hypothetical protein
MATDVTGVSFEKAVARIQQMLDRRSVVTHNEVLLDRLGNRRQCDVVIRGSFGGRPMLGIVECKDHKERIGPDAIEAFAKKTEHLRANARVVVSRTGFTAQSLVLARHEGIGCLSLVGEQPEQVGFAVGLMWYGIISFWSRARLAIQFVPPRVSETFDSRDLTFEGKPILNWFIRELLSQQDRISPEGEHSTTLQFKEPRVLQLKGQDCLVAAVRCHAICEHRKKRKFVSWTGDALYDWHSELVTVPAGGELVSVWVDMDLSTWPDYDGDIPAPEDSSGARVASMVLYGLEPWVSNDADVPDLSDF